MNSFVIFVILLLFYSLRVFHTNLCWWFLTDAWVIASLFWYPGLIGVSKLILMVLWSGWSRFFLFSRPSGAVPWFPITIGISDTLTFQNFFSCLVMPIDVLTQSSCRTQTKDLCLIGDFAVPFRLKFMGKISPQI